MKEPYVEGSSDPPRPRLMAVRLPKPTVNRMTVPFSKTPFPADVPDALWAEASLRAA